MRMAIAAGTTNLERAGRGHLDTFHRRQHRDRRSDGTVAVEQGRSEQPGQDQTVAATTCLLGGSHQSSQREDATLAVVVRPQAPR